MIGESWLTTRKNGDDDSSATGTRSLSGSYGSFLFMVTLIAMVELVACISVWPSGSARTTAMAASVVPAPGRLSMMNGLPSLSSRFFATSRAKRSEPPPAANGTTMVTGRDG